MSIVAAVFETGPAAQGAIDSLLAVGVPADAVSVAVLSPRGILLGLAPWVPLGGPDQGLGPYSAAVGLAAGGSRAVAMVDPSPDDLAPSLVDLGVSDEAADFYAHAVRHGKVFIGVETEETAVTEEALAASLKASGGVSAPGGGDA